MPLDIALGAWPLRLIGGAEAAAQRLRIRLGTHRGEWPLDDAAGLPFVAWADTLPPPVVQIRDLVVFEIEDTPGLRADGVSVAFDEATGTVRVTGRAVYSPDDSEARSLLDVTLLFGETIETFSRVVVLPMT